jgi:hypothetical protein
MCGYFYYGPFSLTLVFSHMVMWQAYIIPGKQRWGPNSPFFIKSEGCERVQKNTWEKAREMHVRSSITKKVFRKKQ